MFAYDYPPSLVGVRRTIKFIRYLRAEGWRCAVITVKPVCGPGWDDAPLREVAPARPVVQRTGSLDPYRLCMKFRSLAWPLMRRVYHGPAGGGAGTTRQQGPGEVGGPGAAIMRFLRRALFIPDDRLGWLPFAVAEGWIAARHWKPDALYSTSYPHTAHLAAAIIRALTGIPWIADFRDGWTQNPAFFNPLTPLHAALHRGLERWVARRADRVVTVSPPITAHLQSLRSSDRPPVETIYNGFDELDGFPSIAESATAPSRKRTSEPARWEESDDAAQGGFRMDADERPWNSLVASDDEIRPVGEGTFPATTTSSRSSPRTDVPAQQFDILYGGTFFGTRRPDTMLRAFAALARRRPDFRRLAKLTLHTSLETRWTDLIRNLGIEPRIELRGFIPHRAILERQQRADVLALVVDTGPGSEIIVTQKVFEYLAAERPIWAIAPPGACRDLLRETGGAALAPPDDVEEAARALEILFDAWLAGESLAADPARLARFHRRAQAQRLAEILNDMIAPPANGA